MRTIKEIKKNTKANKMYRIGYTDRDSEDMSIKYF